MNSLDPKLQEILNQMEPFGFKFFGFDENKRPLVLAPNNQVIEINIAINFVNDQIKKQKSSSGPENMEMPDMPNSAPNPEHSVEVKLESSQESAVENKDSESTQVQNPQNSSLVVQQKAPQVQLKKTIEKPFGDGYEPKTFDPTDIESTLKFIEKNSRASKTSSNKWISAKFNWFMQNYGSTFK